MIGKEFCTVGMMYGFGPEKYVRCSFARGLGHVVAHGRAVTEVRRILVFLRNQPCRHESRRQGFHELVVFRGGERRRRGIGRFLS